MTQHSTADLTPEQVVVQYGQSLNQQNLDAIVALYDQNAEIIPDQLTSLKGYDSIVEFYQQTFQSIQIEGQLKIISCENWQ